MFVAVHNIHETQSTFVCLDFFVVLAPDFFFFFLVVDLDAAGMSRPNCIALARGTRSTSPASQCVHASGSISASSSASKGSDSAAGAVFGRSAAACDWEPAPTKGISPDANDILESF